MYAAFKLNFWSKTSKTFNLDTSDSNINTLYKYIYIFKEKDIKFEIDLTMRSFFLFFFFLFPRASFNFCHFDTLKWKKNYKIKTGNFYVINGFIIVFISHTHTHKLNWIETFVWVCKRFILMCDSLCFLFKLLHAYTHKNHRKKVQKQDAYTFKKEWNEKKWNKKDRIRRIERERSL